MPLEGLIRNSLVFAELAIDMSRWGGGTEAACNESKVDVGATFLLSDGKIKSAIGHL